MRIGRFRFEKHCFWRMTRRRAYQRGDLKLLSVIRLFMKYLYAWGNYRSGVIFIIFLIIFQRIEIIKNVYKHACYNSCYTMLVKDVSGVFGMIDEPLTRRQLCINVGVPNRVTHLKSRRKCMVSWGLVHYLSALVVWNKNDRSCSNI